MANIKQLKVKRDWLILKASPFDTETDSGLARPEGYEERSESGTIVKIGQNVSEDYEVGDTVFFNKYATINLNLGAEEFIVLRDEDIIAYLPGTSGSSSSS